MRKFAMLWVLVCAAVLSAQAQPNGITVTLELGLDQYLPEEDLPVKVIILNRSGQPVILGAQTNWLTFDVLGERQAIVPRLGEMPVMRPFTLLSGQTVTRQYNPTPYFGFRREGRYQLRAFIKLPQWKQEITAKPVSFMIAEGSPLPHLGDLAFGVPPPPGVTNMAPEVRRYSLLKVTQTDQMILYFRLTDNGGRTLRVFPLARMVDFGYPEAQMDRANNLHVLFQTGARTFTYCVLDPNGSLLARQFHEYAQSRPKLRLGEEGQVVVGGGRRLLTWNDIPAPAPAAARSP
jgi:hypothetical protein